MKCMKNIVNKEIRNKIYAVRQFAYVHKRERDILLMWYFICVTRIESFHVCQRAPPLNCNQKRATHKKYNDEGILVISYMSAAMVVSSLHICHTFYWGEPWSLPGVTPIACSPCQFWAYPKILRAREGR